MCELRCEELALRLGISPRAVIMLLDEDLGRGMVERDGSGRWRLTRHAESRYGQALRDLTPIGLPPLRDARPHLPSSRLGFPRPARRPRRRARGRRRAVGTADA